MTLPSGTRLGPYEITSPLGAGGMGEVYRARDARLGRDVAVKVLPADFGADAERRRRFEQEARAASALNHPNIVSIYDIGSEGGIAYIAMELIEGTSLRNLSDSAPISPRRVLEIAAPLADGLARAHAAGIVHRDLKPENVMLSKDGFVKILDFGLAKASAPAAAGGGSQMPTMDPATGAGTVLGTVAYMSPEQASGRPADHRSDQFSFATIVYELLTGKRPFAKPTAVETMSAILREDPTPLSQSVAACPAPLRWIVDRCHAKEPDGRYASTLDLARELKDLRDHYSELSSVSGVGAPAAGPSRGRRIGWREAAALSAAFLVGAAAARLLWRPAPPPPPSLRYLTFGGQDQMPTVSPDGRLLAYCSLRDGKPRIWLQELQNGTETALTAGADVQPRFSPDGASILFTRVDGASNALYRVSVLGGEPRRVMDDASQGDWSPDGRRIAFVRAKPTSLGASIVVCDADGGDPRTLAAVTDKSLAYARWSPDGRTVASGVIGSYAATLETLLLIDAATGRTKSIPSATRGGTIHGLVWSSPRSVLYESTILPAAPGTGSGASFLWEQAVSGGRARQVFSLPGSGTEIGILADGSLVLDQISQSQNLRTYALGTGGKEPPRWITRGIATDRQPFVSPDGRWVLYSSGRKGGIDVWKVALDTGEERRLTESAGTSWDPAFTPDGTSIVFSSNRTGHFEIWKADADGGHPAALTRANLDCENPDPSGDGRWIYFVEFGGKADGIRRIRPDGSGNELVLPGAINPPQISRDGGLVAFLATDFTIEIHSTAGDRPLVLRIPAAFPGGTTGPRYRWLGTTHTLFFLGADAAGRSALFAQDVAEGVPAGPRLIWSFPPETVAETFDVALDGKTLVTAEQDLRANIFLLENVPGVKKTSRNRD